MGRGAAVAGVALVLAGCGGGRLSHDAFVRRADAVCSAYAGTVPLLTRPRSFAAVQSYVERTLPLYLAALDDLRALKPPRQDEAAVRTWLAADRKVVTALRNLRAAALRHDLAATNGASDALQAASLAARRAAGELVLQVCATP